MKKLTILLLCVACVVFASMTFAQTKDTKEAAKPAAGSEVAKPAVGAEVAKPATEAKAVEPLKLGEPVKAEALMPLEKVVADMANLIGKEVVTEGVVVEVEAKGAWIKIGEKEKVQVNAGAKWVFPAEAKGRKALVGGKAEKKETTFIAATGAVLTKIEAKKEEPKKEAATTEMKKEEPKKEAATTEMKKEEPKKEEPKTK
jgi:hypothetical protein